MKVLLVLIIQALGIPFVRAIDASDAVMPDIIAKAETKVEVLMDHIKSTGECFPDPSAAV